MGPSQGTSSISCWLPPFAAGGSSAELQSYPFLRIKRGVKNLAMSQLSLLLPELAKEEARYVFRCLFCSYGTESDQCKLKNRFFFFGSQSQMALPGKHPSEAPYHLLLVSLAISLGVPGTPSSWFHLCQIYMVHLSKKFGQKDFFDKIFTNWVDTARLIPCSAKNCLNTFSNKLAKHVREERDVGKGVCEERECVPPRQDQTCGIWAKHSASQELGLYR